MKTVIIKTAVVFVLTTITIHFHLALLSVSQSYELMQALIY